MIELTKIDIDKNTVTTTYLTKGLTKLATDAGASYYDAKEFQNIYAIEAYKIKPISSSSYEYDKMNNINNPYKLAAYEVTKNVWSAIGDNINICSLKAMKYFKDQGYDNEVFNDALIITSPCQLKQVLTGDFLPNDVNGTKCEEKCFDLLEYVKTESVKTANSLVVSEGSSALGVEGMAGVIEIPDYYLAQ